MDFPPRQWCWRSFLLSKQLPLVLITICTSSKPEPHLTRSLPSGARQFPVKPIYLVFIPCNSSSHLSARLSLSLPWFPVTTSVSPTSEQTASPQIPTCSPAVKVNSHLPPLSFLPPTATAFTWLGLKSAKSVDSPN